MSEENLDEMTYIRVSYGNIERMKAVGKMGDTLNDVVTMLLEYYEDLHHQDWVNTKSNENQHNERSCDVRRLFCIRLQIFHKISAKPLQAQNWNFGMVSLFDGWL